MKCNIKGIDNELRYAMELTSDYLKAELDDSGIEIDICKGDKIEVVFDGDKVKITYPSVPGFLRALMLCSMEIDQGTYNNKSNNVMSKSMFAETDEMKDGML